MGYIHEGQAGGAEVTDRVVVWFSCGAASAIAAKLAVDKYGDKCEIVYCDTSNDEHPDNLRFLADVEKWLNRKVLRLKNEKYKDRWDVYEKTGWLVGKAGARCTVELKKVVRFAFQKPDDIHIIGYTIEEKRRVKRFEKANPDILLEWILIDNNITKQMCYALLDKAGIDLPVMYKMGYKNNNCIGCVKGQAGYWNKIRKDYPEVYDRMAKEERRIGAAINKKQLPTGKWINIYLDELDPEQGNYGEEPDINCDMFCNLINEDMK